jgi:hypothetical protein
MYEAAKFKELLRLYKEELIKYNARSDYILMLSLLTWVFFCLYFIYQCYMCCVEACTYNQRWHICNTWSPSGATVLLCLHVYGILVLSIRPFSLLVVYSLPIWILYDKFWWNMKINVFLTNLQDISILLIAKVDMYN